MAAVVRFLMVSVGVGVAVVVMVMKKRSREEKKETLQPFLARLRNSGL
jgi:hypothetical protein